MALAAGAAFAVLLTACGDDDVASDSTAAGSEQADTDTSAGRAVDAQTDDGESAGAGDDPADGSAGDGATDAGGTLSGSVCDSVDLAMVSEAFPHLEVTGGEERTVIKDDGEVDWQAHGCNWQSDAFDITLAVAGPEGFENGFECVELGGIGDIEPVEGLGDAAWWKWDDLHGSKGSLAVCSGERRIDVDLLGDRGTSADGTAARNGAVALARSQL